MTEAEFKNITGWVGHFPGLIDKVILDANGQVQYHGFAPKGKATSDPAWIIEKLFYDANLNYSYSLRSGINRVFDSYATETYN